MEVTNQSKLLFYGVDILESLLNVKRPFNFEDSISLETTAELIKPSSAGDFRIVMNLLLQVEGYFQLSVKGCGHFQLEITEKSTEKEMNHYVHHNAPAIMFPYLRAFVSTLCAHTGQSLPQIVIPPQFFQGELKEMEPEKSLNMPNLLK
ncbi:MAG: hypothetical protein RL329_1895 [Bacteroidota bacterium]|jgi:preprotein translocase subunit SecB